MRHQLSAKRLWHLWRLNLMRQQRMTWRWLAIATLVGLPVVLSWRLGLRHWALNSDPARADGDTFLGLFSLGLMALGLLLGVWHQYRLTDPQALGQWLMQPASSLEKTLIGFASFCVLLPVVYTSWFTALSCISEAPQLCSNGHWPLTLPSWSCMLLRHAVLQALLGLLLHSWRRPLALHLATAAMVATCLSLACAHWGWHDAAASPASRVQRLWGLPAGEDFDARDWPQWWQLAATAMLLWTAVFWRARARQLQHQLP